MAPGPAVRRALNHRRFLDGFTHVIALGKAATQMALAAAEWQHESGMAASATLVVAPADATGAPAAANLVSGDHPVPGTHSLQAASALSRLVSTVTPSDRVLVLLSGGASSLVGAPISGLSLANLQEIFRQLLRSGLDIHEANFIRRRFLRWGGGRLAESLGPARTLVLVMSDVPGDRPESVASGPMSPDPATAGEVMARLHAHGLTLEPDVQQVLEQMAAGQRAETPKPGAQCFANVELEIIASNAMALTAAGAAAEALGFAVELLSGGLRGEAVTCGQELAQRLCAADGRRHAVIAGGETTVTLDAASGNGGRNQELALAAAQVLRGASNVVLLCAGTDGIDGTTTSAGAVVDGETYGRIVRPMELLVAHDSAGALRQAGALLTTGPTGTNVMDLAIGLRAAVRDAAASGDENLSRE